MEPETLKLIESLATAANGRVIQAGDRTYAQVPAGYKLQEVEPLEPLLKTYVEQKIALEKRESFIEYVNAYKTEATRIFFTRAARQFNAVFDYHAANDKAGRMAHQASYVCSFSDQWAAWSALDGKKIPQQEFAEFLEDRLPDVREPDAATLLEVAQRLQVSRKVNFVGAKNLGNGTVDFQYTEEDDARAGKQNIQVPQEITLGIPVFRGEDPYQVVAKFRYRLDDGKLGFLVKILRREEILDDAINLMNSAISEATGIGIMHGVLMTSASSEGTGIGIRRA